MPNVSSDQAGPSVAEIDSAAATAADELDRDGLCFLGSILPQDTVAALRGEFFRRHGGMLDDRDKEDALRVGNRRFMITVEFAGEFANPMVYANPGVLAVAERALGPGFILENFGVVASLPGAQAQPAHRDGSPLFGEALAGFIPAYALTMAIPLIEMNSSHGTTALWPGTHRYRKGPEDTAPLEPVVAEGSCAMWDYRLVHGGTPNVSEAVRPLVYGTYARKWWRDADNFKSSRQNRLNFAPGFLETVPEEHRHLFSHMV